MTAATRHGARLVALAACGALGASSTGAVRAAPPPPSSLEAASASTSTNVPTLRVASKAFTESVILGELVTQMVRSAGVPASHQSGLGGTRLVWDALVHGEIDVYPEYTGTLMEEILAGEAAPSRTAGKVAAEDADAWLRQTLARRGIGMTAALGFNNTYAIGMASERARQLGLTRISDLRSRPDLRFGFSNEFISRRDGWPAVRARYGLPQTDVKGLDHDLAYRGITAGAIDATDLYATDPEIRRHGLRVLDDDLHGFARYDAVLLYRSDIATRPGGAAAEHALRQLQGRIDAGTMSALNARAKLDRVPEAEVAGAFLRSTFGVVSRAERPGRARTMLARAAEHLRLVAWSLLAAILLAIPLGILAARRPRLGQLVLAATSVMQTVPALALLVFMIPLFGIGALPAMVALFLYSLLPIVRNTHAGLENIPPWVREAADALGLPPRAILWKVNLPLASPFILAGLKSAAVINVGTATLGALIGAGGFGQPIFTGIRLDDVGLILEGAVPASILALVAQGFFELVERLVVPRGLRARHTRR